MSSRDPTVREAQWCGKAQTHSLRNGLDRPAFSGGIAALEHDDDAQALILDPILQMTKFDLQFPQLFFIDLSFHPAVVLRDVSGFLARR